MPNEPCAISTGQGGAFYTSSPRSDDWTAHLRNRKFARRRKRTPWAFYAAYCPPAGSRRTPSLTRGVQHATFSNGRRIAAHPASPFCAGAGHAATPCSPTQPARTSPQGGARQDARCLRQRPTEILCWRRTRQWWFARMPALSPRRAIRRMPLSPGEPAHAASRRKGQ